MAGQRPNGGCPVASSSRACQVAHARLGWAAHASCFWGRQWCELQLLVAEMVEEVVDMVVVLS